MIRRFAVRAITLMLLAGCSALCPAQAPITIDDLRVIEGTSLEQQQQEMLMKFIVQQAGELTQKRLSRLNAIKTDQDFHGWQQANRETFLRLIGGLPEPAQQPGARSPLNARVVGLVAHHDYAVRKLIYESLPGFYVTADLYVPMPNATSRPPYPAVLSPCGHSQNGKAYDVYQHLFIGLVRRGYVVLAYDPIGQGERVQYWDFVHRRSFLDNPDNQHAMAGLQEYLLGEDLARYFIWDGIRGIDYLASLPEVDPERIGVTGSSGGGTLTTYIAMLDARIKVAAPVTFITSIPKKIEARANDRESDPEQDIPGLLAEGIDHAEFLGMIAPRPVLIGAAVRDFFPIEGTRTTFQQAQELYRKLGVSDHIKMVEFDQPHTFSQALRESVEAWFDHWLKNGTAAAHEPRISTERDATLQCTSTGQVITSLGGERVYDYNRARAAELVANLELKRADPARLAREDARVDLLSKIWERLAPPGSNPEPHARNVGEKQVGSFVVEKLLIETEPGIVVPTRIVRLKAQPRRSGALVYLRNRGGDDDSPGFFAEIARRAGTIAIADVRGFGETMSRQHAAGGHLDYFDPRDGIDADFAYDGLFIGRPLLGMRVWDALNVVQYMRSRSNMGAVRVSIAGRGEAGLIALFTAALDAKISAAAVEGAPASFADIARSETYDQPATLLLPGALHDFDLTDLGLLIAPRPLLLLNSEDAMTRRMALEEARRSFEPLRRAYEAASAGDALRIGIAPFEPDVGVGFLDWITRH